MIYIGFVDVWLLVPVAPGLTVLGAWMALIVGGRWRSDPSWVDRLGRFLGVFWVLMAVATVVGTSYLLTHPPVPVPIYAPYAPAATPVAPIGMP